MTEELFNIPRNTKAEALLPRQRTAYASSDGKLHKSLLAALERDLWVLFDEIEEDCGGFSPDIVAVQLLSQPMRNRVEAIFRELK